MTVPVPRVSGGLGKASLALARLQRRLESDNALPGRPNACDFRAARHKYVFPTSICVAGKPSDSSETIVSIHMNRSPLWQLFHKRIAFLRKGRLPVYHHEAVWHAALYVTFSGPGFERANHHSRARCYCWT
jgi:hypothetical protein